MFCENCGTKLPDNSSFCEECGQKVSSYMETKQKLANQKLMREFSILKRTQFNKTARVLFLRYEISSPLKLFDHSREKTNPRKPALWKKQNSPAPETYEKEMARRQAFTIKGRTR